METTPDILPQDKSIRVGMGAGGASACIDSGWVDGLRRASVSVSISKESPTGMRDSKRRRCEPPKGVDATNQEAEAVVRNALDEVGEELCCPISGEVPVDPVSAEDGRIYEREAIQSWMNKVQSTNAPLRSPVTNAPMGTCLIPAIQVRNAIQTMIGTGQLSESLTYAWKTRKKEREMVIAAERAAHEGNAEAAAKLWDWFSRGRKGLAVDLERAFSWSKVGANRGHATCMACCGRAYVLGLGVRRDKALGLYYLGRGVQAGSMAACVIVASLHIDGTLPRDDAEARRLIQMGRLTDNRDLAPGELEAVEESIP